MDRIGGPLRDLLARLRLESPMHGWKAVELWPEVVGERVASRTRAISFREGTLVVEVASAAWMQELGYLKRRLIDDLNRQLGEDAIREVRLIPKSTRTADPGQNLENKGS